MAFLHSVRWQVGVAACVAFLTSVGNAQEWTQFRGPNGSGQSEATSIPDQWEDDDYNWKISLPGIGHSSPVIWKDKLFIMSADPETAQQMILCLNTENGNTNWQKEFPITHYKIHVRNSFASTTPAVDQDHVYVAWATPEESILRAFDHDGNEVWTHKFENFLSRHGFGQSPIVYQDTVILASFHRKPDRNGPQVQTSEVFAVDRKTGDRIWTTPLMSEVASYSVPVILKTDDRPDQLICLSTANGVSSLDPHTGHKNWSYDDAFSMRTVSTPQIVDGLIFGTTGSGAGGNYVVAIKPPEMSDDSANDNSSDGPTSDSAAAELVYKIEKNAPYVPTPVAHGGLLFLWFDKGIVTCIDSADGKVHWTKRVGGNYSGSPVRVGNRLYCIAEDGKVVVIAAADKYQFVAKIPLGEDSRSTPAVAGGRMYLRTYSQLMSIGGK